MTDYEKSENNAHEILVVDDTRVSLRLLTRILTNHGYLVRPASDGPLALKSVAVKTPDLILLDVKMPGMDGYEVCRRLKEDAHNREIPVIFISGLGETAEKIKGFTVGGVDYITKPFAAEEVLARIGMHLHLRELNERLEEKVRERTERLSIANNLLKKEIAERKRMEKERRDSEARLRQHQKLESIGLLAGGVAHEINNPINGIMNYAQLIKDRLNPDNSLIEFADEIIIETNRVAAIVRNLLTFARYENNSQSSAKISDIVESSLSLIQTVMRHDQILLETDVPDDLPWIRCRNQQIRQVLMNLMTNARDALNAKYPKYHENKKLKIFSYTFEKQGSKWIRTTVKDHGSGITPEVRDRMFDPFFSTKPRENGTGLGLSISYGIVKEHHGLLYMESEPGQYTQFHMELPVLDG